VRAPILLDTGPLVALLNARDAHHGWARELLASVAPPLVTCEAVLSEACFLVRQLHGGRDRVLELVHRGAVAVPFRLEDELPAVRRLLSRYADVPMSLADACLVRMTEALSDSVILTTDADFRIYRRHSRQAVPCVMPY